MLHVLEAWPPINLTSLSFLFVFLPLSVAAFYLLPPKWRGKGLLAICAVYLFLVNPLWALVLIGLTLFNFVCGRLLARFDKRVWARRGVMALCAAVNLLVIVIVALPAQRGEAPFLLGFAVCPLLGLTAVGEFYRRETGPESDFYAFALHCLFFPRLYGGPFGRYGEFREKTNLSRQPGADLFEPLSLFVRGAFKVAVLGARLRDIMGTIDALPAEQQTTLSAWSLVLVFGMALYFTLSGFCDMAAGLGGLFGIPMETGFFYPYQSRNLRNFALRFHGTLSKAVGEMVRGLFGGRAKETAVSILCTFLTGAVVGLWFRLDFSSLLWGVWIALFVVLERHLIGKALSAVPTALGRLYNLLVVVLSLPFLLRGAPWESLSLLRGMIPIGGASTTGGGGEHAYNAILYILSSNWLALALGVLLCTSLLHLGVVRLKESAPRVSKVVLRVVDLGMLVLITASLV